MSFNEDIEMYSPRRPMKSFSPKRANSTPLLSIARENNAENSTMDHALQNGNEPEQTTSDCYLTVTITVTQC